MDVRVRDAAEAILFYVLSILSGAVLGATLLLFSTIGTLSWLLAIPSLMLATYTSFGRFCRILSSWDRDGESTCD